MSFASVYGLFTEWLKDCEAVRQLDALTDEQLQDVGLCRAEIHEAVTRQSTRSASNREAWRRLHRLESGFETRPMVDLLCGVA